MRLTGRPALLAVRPPPAVPPEPQLRAAPDHRPAVGPGGAQHRPVLVLPGPCERVPGTGERLRPGGPPLLQYGEGGGAPVPPRLYGEVQLARPPPGTGRETVRDPPVRTVRGQPDRVLM
ncbi:hypothetical protein A8W25_00260 [Streptomyces sp. ERV7]|nr:hypothetical protein A8W25_00260 [Streptomyces sp. ERV7]